MSVWALVPAKGFDRGKSRLSSALSDEARARFARALFDHVVSTLTGSGVIAGVLCATDSPLVAEAAYRHGAAVRMDAPGAARLSAVVDAGVAELAARGARAALVLMADLPRLTHGDVRDLAGLLEENAVVLVRAEDGRHTNALGMRPPGCLRTAFGREDSFEAHLQAARAAGLQAAVLESAGIAFDVDGPEEHTRLLAAGGLR